MNTWKVSQAWKISTFYSSRVIEFSTSPIESSVTRTVFPVNSWSSVLNRIINQLVFIFKDPHNLIINISHFYTKAHLAESPSWRFCVTYDCPIYIYTHSSFSPVIIDHKSNSLVVSQSAVGAALTKRATAHACKLITGSTNVSQWRRLR